LLTACRPDESPAFIHGRPSTAAFDLAFNTRPFLAHHGPEEREDEGAIASAIRLQATTVSLADGTRQEIYLSPSSVNPSSKGY